MEWSWGADTDCTMWRRRGGKCCANYDAGGNSDEARGCASAYHANADVVNLFLGKQACGALLRLKWCMSLFSHVRSEGFFVVYVAWLEVIPVFLVA